MVRASRKGDGGGQRRPVRGGVALAILVIIGLIVFFLFGGEHGYMHADGPLASALVFVFVPKALILEDDASIGLYAFFVACTLIALVSAFYAVTRKEWTLAWICSLFGTAFGPFTLVPILMIGTSDIFFQHDSISDRLQNRKVGQFVRKDPFLGVIAAVAVAFLGGTSLVVILDSLTNNLALSILIQVGILILIFWSVTFVRSIIDQRKKAIILESD